MRAFFNMATKLNPRHVSFLGVIGIAFSSVFIKFTTAPSLVIALYRMIMITAILLPIILFRERRDLNRGDIPAFLKSGVGGFFLAIHFYCFYESLKYTTIASSTVLVDMEIFFVALGSFFFLHERIPLPGYLGIAVTFSGSVVIALGDKSQDGDSFHGDLLAIGGAMAAAAYTLIGRRERRVLSTTAYTFFVYLGAGLVLLLASLASSTPLSGYDPKNIWIALAMTVFCTLFGHSLLSWGLGHVNAAFISTIKLGEPPIATVLGILFFRQFPFPNQILGGILVLIGLFIYTRWGAREGRAG